MMVSAHKHSLILFVKMTPIVRKIQKNKNSLTLNPVGPRFDPGAAHQIDFDSQPHLVTVLSCYVCQIITNYLYPTKGNNNEEINLFADFNIFCFYCGLW